LGFPYALFGALSSNLCLLRCLPLHVTGIGLDSHQVHYLKKNIRCTMMLR
jgi:hypothetical protein